MAKAKSKSKAKASSTVKVSVNVGSKNRYVRPRRGMNLTPAPMYHQAPIVIHSQSSQPQIVYVPNQSHNTATLPPVGITNTVHHYTGVGETKTVEEPPKPEKTAGEKTSMVGSGIKVAGEVLEHISPTAGNLVKRAGSAIETAGGLASSAQQVAEKFPLTTGLVSSVASGAGNLLRGSPEAIEKPFKDMTNKELHNYIYSKRPADDKTGITKLKKEELIAYANRL